MIADLVPYTHTHTHAHTRTHTWEQDQRPLTQRAHDVVPICHQSYIQCHSTVGQNPPGNWRSLKQKKQYKKSVLDLAPQHRRPESARELALADTKIK
jgi:hypothetical protein